MFGIGVFSPNDILEKENMNGCQSGDEERIKCYRKWETCSKR